MEECDSDGKEGVHTYFIHVKPDVVFPTVLDEKFIFVFVATDVHNIRRIVRRIIENHDSCFRALVLDPQRKSGEEESGPPSRT